MGLGDKETILINYETELEKIKTADGYSNTVQDVDRQFNVPDPLKYPSVYINDIATTRTQLLKDLFKNDWSVNLVLYVFDNLNVDKCPLGELETAMNAFILDVKKAVLADITRGGQARNTAINRERIAPDGFNPPQAAIVMETTVEYYSQY